jgi:putative transposase
MVTPVAKRHAVVHLCEAHGVSQRRACDVLQVDRSSVRYLSRRGDDVDLRDAIKRVSRERRRFGYRRIHVMVAREGFDVSYYPAVHVYMHERAQEGEAHLYRREAAGTAQRRQEACFGHQKADGAA